MGPPRLVIVAVMAPAAIGLVLGVWGGLLRAGWKLPLAMGSLISEHGGLMVGAFLGTLIGVERAVALGARWPWVAPSATGVAGLLLVVGVDRPVAVGLLAAGSAVFVAVTGAIAARQWATFTALPVVGALAWCAGNLAWFRGTQVPAVVPAWMVFLLLTIAGERLELGRVRRPPAWAGHLLVMLVAVLVLSLAATGAGAGESHRVQGACLLGIALWLAVFDVARVTIRSRGLPRYVAACLLSGFGWLGLAGILGATLGPLESGLEYDAWLHCFFVGFVFTMIFGHAPIVFPAVLRVALVYSPVFYLPLGLLHLGLAVRVAGDLADSGWARSIGAAGSAMAIAAFPLAVVGTTLRPRAPTPPGPR